VNQQTQSAPSVVRLDEGKNLDKTIDLARFGAVKDHVTVIIERTLTTKRGDPRRIPILEITPKADIREILAPRLRTPIAQLLTEADLDYRSARMNKRSAAGHVRLTEAVKVSRDYMRAKDEYDAENRSRKQRKRARRPQQQRGKAA
jgi:hypothetical protein